MANGREDENERRWTTFSFDNKKKKKSIGFAKHELFCIFQTETFLNFENKIPFILDVNM